MIEGIVAWMLKGMDLVQETVGQSGLVFARPWWLLLLIPFLIALLWRLKKLHFSFISEELLPFNKGSRPNDQPKNAVAIGSLEIFEGMSSPAQLWKGRVGETLRWLTVACLIFALARPQYLGEDQKKQVSGVNIMLVIDTSGSMKARDYDLRGQTPTRMEVVKEVIDTFISQRRNDRIGLVVFGSEAFTQAPLTLDHKALRFFLKQVDVGMAGEATAIGDGVATAVLRLRDIKDESRVVVLLTDGASNAGRVDPLAAAKTAATLGVRVHAIGVGNNEDVQIDQNGRPVTIRGQVDAELLGQIASQTGGVYRMVTDTKALMSVYDEIDRLERKKIEDLEIPDAREFFGELLILALVLWCLELIWRQSFWRIVPE